MSASPSMPAGTGRSASTSNAGADHSRQGRCGSRPWLPRPEGAPATVIPCRPSSIRGRVPEPTAPNELAHAFEGPARKAGLAVERELAARLLDYVAG
jgi:hypothetical protein